MKGNEKVRSLMIVSGMTLVLFAVQAVLGGRLLLHIESAVQAMGLSALFALIYACVMGAFVWREKPNTRTLLFVGIFMAVTMVSDAEISQR